MCGLTGKKELRPQQPGWPSRGLTRATRGAECTQGQNCLASRLQLWLFPQKQANSGFLNYHWSWKCMLASDQSIFKQPAGKWLPAEVTLSFQVKSSSSCSLAMTWHQRILPAELSWFLSHWVILMNISSHWICFAYIVCISKDIVTYILKQHPWSCVLIQCHPSSKYLAHVPVSR